MVKEKSIYYGKTRTITIFKLKENTKLIDFFYLNTENVPIETKVNLYTDNFKKLIATDWQNSPVKDTYFDNAIVKDYIYYPLDNILNILL